MVLMRFCPPSMGQTPPITAPQDTLRSMVVVLLTPQARQPVKSITLDHPIPDRLHRLTLDHLHKPSQALHLSTCRLHRDSQRSILEHRVKILHYPCSKLLGLSQYLNLPSSLTEPNPIVLPAIVEPRSTLLLRGSALHLQRIPIPSPKPSLIATIIAKELTSWVVVFGPLTGQVEHTSPRRVRRLKCICDATTIIVGGSTGEQSTDCSVILSRAMSSRKERLGVWRRHWTGMVFPSKKWKSMRTSTALAAEVPWQTQRTSRSKTR